MSTETARNSRVIDGVDAVAADDDVAAARETIAATAEAFGRAWNARDIDGVMRTATPDLRTRQPDGTTLGFMEARTAWAGYIASGATHSIAIETIDVKGQGTAVVDEMITITSNGGTLLLHGVVDYRYANGEWKIEVIRTFFVPDPPQSS
ncbi:MAG TPA: nuclear transport factor 2 family protein [Acidobacteriaceae bacterium]|nr:nuclear transport factor 2 family protein [Acidobacteriaceae bacterium]